MGIPLATGKGNINVESWSPFSEEELSSSNTETLETTTVKEIEHETPVHTHGTTVGPIFPEETTTTSHELPLIPFIPLPAGIPTGIFQTTTPQPASFSPKFSRTSTTFLPSTYSTQRTTVNLPSESMVSDPRYFAVGLDERFTTSAPGNLNCSEKIKKAATELVPSPFCDCPAGQMRNINGLCVESEISTFKARLVRICGEQLRDLTEEAQILTWKVCFHEEYISGNSVGVYVKLQTFVLLLFIHLFQLSIALNYPVCVRKADDVIIFNTVCKHCEYADLVDQYATNSILPEIDLQLNGGNYGISLLALIHLHSRTAKLWLL